MFGGLFDADMSARAPTQLGEISVETPPIASGDFIFGGETVPPGEQNVGRSAQSQDDGKTYSLNFDGVDITAAAQVLLGDILQQPYSIDPRVNGKITLASARPVTVRNLLFVFENALAANGVAMVKSAGAYRIVPATEALTSGDTTLAPSGQAEPGYGISILPIRYVSAKTLLQLMDGFSSKLGMVRIDASRNLMIVQGSGNDRTVVMQSALAFDTDWMRDQAVGVFALENSAPVTLIKELQQVFRTDQDDLAQGLIRFLPIERLNAVMAVSKRRDLIESAGAWIHRLDRNSVDGGQVYVYKLRHGDSKVIANILNDVFADPGGSDVAPDGGVSTGAAVGQGSEGGGLLAAVTPATEDLRIVANPSNNSLVIVATRETYKKIEAALQRIDQPPMQVAVHAIVAEVTLNDQLRNGVEFFLKSSDIGLGKNNGSFGIGATEVLKRVIPGFNFLIGANAEPRLIISALDTITSVKVISSPSLVVINNQQATLQVGSQVPIATRQASDVTDPNAPIVNNIEFRDTGIILKVTPRISENGAVNMEIEQEISAVSKDSASGTLTPVITTRKISSSISVVSGQTVVLGGLISEQEDKSSSGLPFLNRKKFLGLLGGRRNREHRRTELIMFIKPEVIRNGLDAEAVAAEMAMQLRAMLGPDSAPPSYYEK